MSESCFVFTSGSGENSTVTPSNFKSVLEAYYKGQKLSKTNGSFWSSSQDFNQENYLMCALMVNLTYLCCTGPNHSQSCPAKEIDSLTEYAGVTNKRIVFSNFKVLTGTEKNAWFATIGLIKGTNLGVISFRGTQTGNEWTADATPGLPQSMFKTCKYNMFSVPEPCEVDTPSYFIDAVTKSSYPEVHVKMLEIYNNSYVSVEQDEVDYYYTVAGAVELLYPKDTQWIITGHSLGAGLAELCTADLASKGKKIHSSYLFANPSPGNDVYLDVFNKLSDNNQPGNVLKKVTYNIKNQNDLVANVTKFYQWGRHLVGTVKKFDGSGSKFSLSGIGIAHNMCVSYMIGGIPTFFNGNSGDLTAYIESYSLSSSTGGGVYGTNKKAFVIVGVSLLGVIGLIILFKFNRKRRRTRGR
jgi:hypothetical protein